MNGPRGDPVLFIEFKFAQRAVLFDLGDLHLLPPRKLLKISQVCVSHTHMDHFIGFDHLLRVSLGRDKKIHFYGPPGFIRQMESKLNAYSWNLVENYQKALEIIAVEVQSDHLREVRFPVGRAFRRGENEVLRPFNGCLHREEAFEISAAFLDHKIPCLSFSLEERRHINILKTGLEELGLPKGLWLKGLKEAIWSGEGDETPIRVWSKNSAAFKERAFPLGFLKKHLVKITPGQKIGFVVDTILNPETEKKIVSLVWKADLLFIEAAFLDEDQGRARDTYHLTARQAGILAGLAGVKKMIPIHFSPKYAQNPEDLERESLEAFRLSS